MKKVLALLLVLMMTLSLAACSGMNETPPEDNDSDGSQQEQIPDESNENREDEEEMFSENDDSTPDSDVEPESLDAYMAQFGMTEEDLKVDGVKEVVLTDVGDVEIYTEGNPSLEEIKAWYEKIYAKCCALADDNKVYTPESFNLQGEVIEQTEYILSEQVDWENDFSGGWGTANTESWVYSYNGETVWIVARWESNSDGEYLIFAITYS